MNMKDLLAVHRREVALIIGNGINRYGEARQTNSWQELLIELASNHLPSHLGDLPAGVSLTEFYDVLELKSQLSDSTLPLQQEFCDLMASWTYYDHHKHIVRWAQEAEAPILTTNFESTLSEAGNCRLFRTKQGGFTDYYPWESYYGNQELTDPSRGFGIWHINGMQHYRRSIRLGLTHYMGSVERARGWLHKGNEKRLFSGKNQNFWEGFNSWLHVVFNKELLIFGLDLGENEVFLRWLLIERARYFKKFPSREKSAWYVYSGELNNPGKRFFLEGVGIETIRVANYDDIYGPTIWE